MDRSWIRQPITSFEYQQGVSDFIAFAKNNMNRESKIRCPCNNCNNLRWKTIEGVIGDLYIHKFSLHYKRWFWHGEDVPENMNYWDFDDDNDDLGEEEENNEGEEYDEVGEMYEGTNAEGQTEDYDPNVGMEECCFDRLLREAQRELYPGCQDVSLLSFLVKILHLKVLNKWSNKSFEMTLQLFKEVLPKHSTIPDSPYEVKKILRDLGLGYVSIDACKNDCVLFWKELSERNTCPICEEPRWKIYDNKGKRVPHKILGYFPLTPRLKRLFMSKQIASAMRWHKEKRKEESNILRHPADGEAWKHLDLLYPDFAQDSRNVRLDSDMKNIVMMEMKKKKNMLS